MTPDADLLSISLKARRVLTACVCWADADGTIQARIADLARFAGLHRVSAVQVIAELRAAGLIRTGGSGHAHYIVLDDKLRRALRIPATRRGPTGALRDPEFRALRAQVGGVKRALREAQRQRDVAMRKIDELMGRGAFRENIRAAELAGADAEVAAMRRDLLHAADCGDPNCVECEAILYRAESGRRRYATEDEIAERLRKAEALEVAARATLEAVKARGVGARASVGVGLRALALALDGKHAAAIDAAREK